MIVVAIARATADKVVIVFVKGEVPSPEDVRVGENLLNWGWKVQPDFEYQEMPHEHCLNQKKHVGLCLAPDGQLRHQPHRFV
jgi:hypothetical protein